MSIEISTAIERWPLKESFTISRGTRTEAAVVVVTLEANGKRGRGECTPYPRYGESLETTVAHLESLQEGFNRGISLEETLQSLPAGAAKNALNCAWWDLRCKTEGRRITDLLNVSPLHPVTTAYTISLADPQTMKESARKNAHRPLIKIKIGSQGGIDAVTAVREGAPESRLIVDANEAVPKNELADFLAKMKELGVEFVEQPLPAGDDEYLREIVHPLPIVADEAFHTAKNIPQILGKYDGINIKLDKTGGLTGGLEALRAAREANLLVMLGCMLSSSLGIAPGFVVAQEADYVDLDAPLLLAKDRPDGIQYDGSIVNPFEASLWG